MNIPALRLATILTGALALLPPSLSSQAPPANLPNASSAAGSVGRDTSPLNPENALEMSNPQQKAEFDLFLSVPPNQPGKKVSIGEEFLRRYPGSHYTQAIYSGLAVAYIENGQADKGYTAGASAVRLDPNDIRTMGVLCQSMARLYNPQQPGSAQDLAQAEKYGKQAIDTAAALKKPAKMSDKDFQVTKDEALAMVHSGLGLVFLRKSNFTQAISELEQAVSLDSKHDPTNLYLLGVANQNASHFDAAAQAFTRCAASPGNLQATCKAAAETAHKSLGKSK